MSEILGNDGNGWAKSAMYIHKELERLAKSSESLEIKIDALSEKVTTNRIKVAGLGATVAIIVSLLMNIVAYLIRG